MVIREIHIEGFEQVIVGKEAACGYHGHIAVHSTKLGPAVGGTRVRSFNAGESGLADALQLAQAMSYKTALAGLPFGGGKAVIEASTLTDRNAALESHAQLINYLGGRFITAEDVGTTPADMDFLGIHTPHVAGVSQGAGNPAPFTARGVIAAMHAAAIWLWGHPRLAGRTVAVQGAGQVGLAVTQMLAAEGATVLVADVDPRRAELACSMDQVFIIEPREIHQTGADILCPCALGACISQTTISDVKAAAIVGAANNQLSRPEDADELAARGILYVPDFVANAGGAIAGCHIERLGATLHEATRKVDEIELRVTSLLIESARKGITPHAASVSRAQRILADG